MSSSIHFIIPELIMSIGAVILLIGGVTGLRRSILGFIAIGTIILGFLSMLGDMGHIHAVFSGMLINDAFSYVMKLFVLVVAALAVLLSIGYSWPDDDDTGEYYFFLLIASVSMMFAVSAGNLIMIYLAVETLSIISYILACYFKKDVYSTEAGLKYFLFGALSTGLLLYGISLIYGLFGTLDLEGIFAKMGIMGGNEPILALAAILIFAGFAFKASVVPFHMWVADVYNGAPWPVAAFFSVGPKALGFALLVKVFFGYSVFLSSSWTGIAAVLAMATMTIGNLSAFHQNNIKRLLAFSSVAQAGYILAGLTAGFLGVKAAFFYIFVYTFMNMGAFACAAFLSSEQSDLKSFQGISRRAPAGAILFSIFLLSLAGLPPLAGFLAKFFVILATIETRHYFLAAVIALNSVIAFFYYLKIIKTMFIDEPSASLEKQQSISLALLTVLAICVLVVIVTGIFPEILFSFINILFA